MITCGAMPAWLPDGKTVTWHVPGLPTSGLWRLSPAAPSPNSASGSEMPSKCHRLASSHPTDCPSKWMRKAGCGRPIFRLSRPQPDYGIGFTALFPVCRAVEGTVLQLRLHDAEATDGRALATVTNLLRWEEFSRGTGRGLLVAACRSPDGPRFFAIDSREAARRAAHNGAPAVAIPDAYELDDLTFGLLWACASLDTGLQMDDQELTMAAGELAAYESLPFSAVSREAAAGLGMTSQI
jgi:hypothetical protein